MHEEILTIEPNDSMYPLFLSVPELLLKIRATFSNQDSHSEEKILNKYSMVKTLFLDDLGAEKHSAWAVQTLFSLIDRRYGAMLPTFFSSNFPLDELAVRLDDRITSRIAEMCQVYEIKGRDRRIK